MALSLQTLAEQHRIAQTQASAVAERALAQVWDRSLSPRALDATFPAYLRQATAVVGAGRRISHETAMAYYRASRVAAGYGLEGAVALAAPALDVPRTAATLRITGPGEIKRRIAAGESLGSATQGALALTLGDAKRMNLGAGRETLLAVAQRDPKARGWARVSDGSPCHFCAMLVSRGPVYTEGSARFQAHGRCGCEPAFVWENGGDGWTPEARALRDLWDEDKDLNVFRSKLRRALATPETPVAKAFAAKLAPLAPNRWLDDFYEVVDRMPADKAAIGTRRVRVAAEDVRQKALDEVARRFGGTPAEIRAALDEGRSRADRLRSLYERFDIEGLWRLENATDLPDDVRAALRALGFSGRRRPELAARDLMASWKAQESALRAGESRYRLLVTQWDEIQAHVYPSAHTTKKVDDLLDDGRLGTETAKALDDTLEAGRILDEEIERRLGGLEARSAALQEAAEKARWEFEKAYQKYLDVAYADATPAREILDAVKAQSEAARQARRVADNAAKDAWLEVRAARPRITMEVLTEARTMGGPGTRYKGPAEVVERLKAAEAKYPSDWLLHLRGFAPEIEVLESARGYNAGGRKIALSGRGDAVATHELGHSMELAVPGLTNLEWAFHYRRSAIDAPGGNGQTLSETFALFDGQDVGMGKEIAHRDAWANPYTGKTYRHLDPDKPGAESQWEVFQTGVESLYDGSPYFERPGGTDVEFRRFILGVLGVL